MNFAQVRTQKFHPGLIVSVAIESFAGFATDRFQVGTSTHDDFHGLFAHVVLTDDFQVGQLEGFLTTLFL